MKNYFKIISLLLFGFLIISCSREEDKATLNLSSKGELKASKTSVVLNENTASAEVIGFSWVNPVFNPAIAPKQYLEFAKTNTNFAAGVKYPVSNESNGTALTHLQLNNLLNAINVTPDQINNLEVRLVSEAGTKNSYYSTAIPLAVTPYTPNPDLIYPKINVPGSYAGAAGYQDWTPANSPNLYSPLKNQKYRGFIYIAAPNSAFKFAINEDWPGSKGDTSSVTPTGILTDNNGQDIKASAAGTYYLNVDWLENTYTTALANFGIIGDATPNGYASDTDLVYNPLTKKYVISSMSLTTTGVFKFRANDAWNMKFQPAATDQTLVSGKKVQTFLSSENTVTNDPGYKVDAAGNYKIELDLHNSAFYSITITKL